MSAAALRDRTQQLVRDFRARPDVEYAQLNYILRILDKTPNDPRYAQQWHYFNNGTGADQYPGGINLPKAWDSNTGGSSVVVAVIDTGILPNHPDIQGSPNLVAGYDMITDVFTANDGSGRDGDPADPGDAVAANECGYPHEQRQQLARHPRGRDHRRGQTNNGRGRRYQLDGQGSGGSRTGKRRERPHQ
jgi:serine protease